MAQKRMLDKKISVSEQVSNLPLEAQIIFTWSIPHADDLGLMPFSTKTLKAMIVPMMNISQETFDFQIEKIRESGLFEIFEDVSENKLITDKYYRIIKFNDHQTLKRDRQPQTYLKHIIGKNFKDSWNNIEKMGFQIKDIDDGFQMETNGIQMESEEKRREEKRSKDNIREDKKELVTKLKFSEFNNVLLEETEHRKLVATLGEKNTNILIEELGGYLASTNKRYASHYATLLNWARRKVGEYNKGAKKRTIA